MGFLGIAVTQGAEQERDLWNLVLLHFRPDAVFVLGGVEWTPYRQNVSHVTTLAAAAPEAELVVVAPANGTEVAGDTSLISFEHPDLALYVFGQDNAHLSEACFGGRTPFARVFVPTDGDYQMHSHSAGLLTLYDRRVKRG